MLEFRDVCKCYLSPKRYFCNVKGIISTQLWALFYTFKQSNLYCSIFMLLRAVTRRCALYRIIGYKEHLLALKSNNKNSAFAPLLLAKGHAIGPMEEFMDLLYITLHEGT